MIEHSPKCAGNRVWVENMLPVRGECDCDGYHTFEELYDHRVILFITLCRVLLRESEQAYDQGMLKDLYYRNGNVWRSKKHSDGSMFAGLFIMGIRTDPNYQLTYHLPLKFWDQTDFAFTLKKAPEWDGHTPDDVLGRLGLL